MNKQVRKVHDERAQGVIEFALIASILMLMFLGTVDFARFMYYDNAIRSAARVGAETAIDHCIAPGMTCGFSTISDAFVMQATECEAVNSVQLLPHLSTNTPYYPCATCPSTGCTYSTTPTSTCDSNCTAADCTEDVCLQTCSTSCSNVASGSTFSSGTTVKVIVGYNFQPISPVLNGAANLPLIGPLVNFFQPQACWSGDSTTSNHHTLCASATGRVS